MNKIGTEYEKKQAICKSNCFFNKLATISSADDAHVTEYDNPDSRPSSVLYKRCIGQNKAK